MRQVKTKRIVPYPKFQFRSGQIIDSITRPLQTLAMSTTKSYRKWVILVHLVFWITLMGLMSFIFYFLVPNKVVRLAAILVNLLGLSILIYGHLLYLLPRFFDRKKYKEYALGLLLLLLGTNALRFFVGWGWTKSFNWPEAESFTPSYFGAMFFGGVFFLLISIPLRLIDNWFKKRELEKELKTHQLEAELRFLKAQVNPHFLFNALNNIYSLSFTESKKTPEMILKLSDMMSYMLYDCKSEKVKLSSEIEYLRNYIDLQQLKKDGELNIQFDVVGNASNILITPMLFIPFFENVFKHGNMEDTENGWLKSELKVEGNQLSFFIKNSMRTEPTKKEKGGVGLENIKNRLKLLFPEKHELNIQNSKDTFSVNLKIILQPNELPVPHS